MAALTIALTLEYRFSTSGISGRKRDIGWVLRVKRGAEHDAGRQNDCGNSNCPHTFAAFD
jgi:hypothetical protein